MVTLKVSCDEKLYWKMREHKNKLEKENQKKISWEKYLAILFGMAKG